MLLNDDSNVMTPTSILNEPYFDTQIQKNLTALVGKVK